MEVERRALVWLLTGRGSITSGAMLAIYLDIPPRYTPYFFTYAEFSECLSLLEAVPEVRAAFPKIAEYHAILGLLVDNFSELEKMAQKVINHEMPEREFDRTIRELILSNAGIRQPIDIGGGRFVF